MSLGAANSQAASSTFIGGTDSNFATPTNWSAGVPGVVATGTTTSADIATFNATPAAPSTTSITIDNNRTLGGITFDTAAPAFTIGTDAVNVLRLSTNLTTQIASTFTGTGITEAINAPITLIGNYTFANNAATAQNTLLSFGGNIAGGNTTNLGLTVTGVGNTAISGVISNGTSANFNVVKTGTGTLTLSAANTFTGQLTSSTAAGTVIATNTQAFGSNAAAVSGTGTAAGAINVSAASTLSLLNNGSGSNGTIIYGPGTGYGATLITGSTLNVGANSGANTGNTIQLGSLQLFNTGTLTVNGTSGYGLSVAGVTNFGSSGGQGNIALSANTAVALNGGVTEFIAATTTRTATFQGAGTFTINGGISVNAASGTTTATAGVTVGSAAAATTVVLNGAGNYTGPTTITNGTLRTATATSGLGSTSGVSIATTGLLDLRSDTTATFGNGTAGYNITSSAAGASLNAAPATTATGNTVTLGTVGFTANNASLTLTNGGSYNLAFGTLTGTLGSTINNNLVNGTATFASATSSSTGAPVLTFGGTSATGTTVVTGAVTNGSVAVGVAKTGAGTLLLNGANTYTGTTTVSAGTLGGSGSIGVSAATVASGAALSPGATGGSSLATMSFGSTLALNGSYRVDISAAAGTAQTAGTNFDQIVTTGALTLSNATSLLALGTVNNANLAVGQVFPIALDGGTNALTAFSNVAQGGTVTDANGDTFTVSYTANFDGGATANDISLTVASVAPVPEPTTLLGGALLLGALGFAQRRNVRRWLGARRAA